MLSQLLTLYTTPVIYLFFDAAAKRLSTFHLFSHKEAQKAQNEQEA